MQGTFWQAKYYPFEMDTQEKVDSMHKNPVDRGLVERAIDCRGLQRDTGWRAVPWACRWGGSGD